MKHIIIDHEKKKLTVILWYWETKEKGKQILSGL